MAKRGRVKYSGAFPRFRDRLDSEEDDVEFDESKPLSESIRNCLREVTTKSGKIRKARKLAHLGALVKMWEKREEMQYLADPCSLRLRGIMLCLRIPLCQESVEVRAATLRALRYMINSEGEVHDFISLNGHFLLARCLDIELDNKVERVQALRLVRKMAFVGPKHFPLTLVRSLVAIAEDGKKECDRLYRICLACLCELSVLNSQVFIESNGVNALTYCLLDTSLPRVSEAIIACLLRLHNNPILRSLACIDLGVVVAPFTEFRYVHSGHLTTPAGPGTESSTVDEKVRRFQIAENAILSLMRSWTGIIQLAQTRAYGGSHLQALVDILYLNNNEVRKRLVLLIFELLHLKPPKETSHIDLALQVTNPSTFRESWKLADGFVALEGLDILPHLAKSRPNLLENHKCFTLGCLLNTGLPEALVEVIISTDTELSILSTILLGELLHSASVILPRELNATSHCLPALLAEIAGSDPNRSNRASEAVVALQKIHSIKKRGPVACSLFLDQILASSGRFYGECFVGDRLLSPNWNTIVKRSSDEQIRLNVKQSKVNESIDAKSWDWDLISAVLKWPSENFHHLDVADHRQFVKRVADFFKPSYHLFSKIELISSKAKFLAKIGCYLLDFLVSGKSVECHIILDDFLLDIKSCLESLIASKSIHDCLLSPTRVATTASQFYFAFIGRMSYTPVGRKVLDKLKFLPCLVELLSLRSDLYLKLVISCLDYSSPDWGARNLLSKALKEGSELCKLYSTRFLGILIRSKTPNIAQWGIELLVGQLFDDSNNVPWTALDLLDEACDDKMNLEAVVCALGTDISLEHLGIRGSFLRNRFYCSSNAIKLLTKRNKEGKTVLEMELEKWAKEWNIAYVIILEDLLNDGLTRHQRNDDRCYGRRSHEAHSLRDIYVPAHLYGQLALTKFGLENLIKDEELARLLEYLREVSDSPSSPEWLKIKSAIWAAANIALSNEGVLFIEREGAIKSIVNIAEKCQVISLRGTAFYALGLVATTRQGSAILGNYGWCSLRYGRDEKWPVLEDWFNKIHWMSRQFESELANFEDDFIDLGIEESVSTRKTEDITLNPETPPEFYLNVSSTESSPKGTSLTGRKRLSDLFRSFNLGSGGGIIRQQRRNSETGKSLTEKIKKNLFPRSRTHSHSSSGDRDEHAGTNFSPRKSIPSAHALKTVQESDRLAPMATPESSGDSKQSEFSLSDKTKTNNKTAPEETVLDREDSGDTVFSQDKFVQTPADSAFNVTLSQGSVSSPEIVILTGQKTVIAPLATPESLTASILFGRNKEDVESISKVPTLQQPQTASNKNNQETSLQGDSMKTVPSEEAQESQDSTNVIPSGSELQSSKEGEIYLVPTSSLSSSTKFKLTKEAEKSPIEDTTEIHAAPLSELSLETKTQAQVEIDKLSEPGRTPPSVMCSPTKFKVQAIIEPEPRPVVSKPPANTKKKTESKFESTEVKIEPKKEIISFPQINPKHIETKFAKSKGFTNLPSIAIIELQNDPTKGPSKNDKNLSQSPIIQVTDMDIKTAVITPAVDIKTAVVKPVIETVQKLNGHKKLDEKLSAKITPLDFSKIDDKVSSKVVDFSKMDATSSASFNKLSPIASSPTDTDVAKSVAPTFESTPMTKEQILQHSRSRSHVRSGQRALSESEAQNISGLSGASNKRVYGNISTATAASGNTWSITSISSIGSWTDNPGYLTFRSIHNRRRPPLSESESDATGTGALLIARDEKPDVVASVTVHRSDSWSRKSRSLDYRLTKLRHRQRPPEFVSEMGSSAQNRSFSAPPARPPHLIFAVQEEPIGLQGPEPHYWGITVPAKIETLFPELPELPDVSEERLPVPDPIPEPDLLSIHPKNQGLATTQGLEMHTPFLCLSCYRLFAPASTGLFIELDTESLPASKSNKSSPASLRKQVTVAEGEKASVAAMGAVAAGLSRCQSSDEQSGINRFVQRKEIIKLISCMNATVGAKTAEQGLLKYKQLHPTAFNDLCLYSEVCLLLTNYSFRISSRRFIQELFMDLQFEALYIEPYQLLGSDLSEVMSGFEVSDSTLSHRSLTQVAESVTEDTLSSAASSPFS